MESMEEKSELNENVWTRVERKVRVNDMLLAPWERAGAYDGIIKNYLKKRFLKETMSVILFDIFFLLVGVFGLVYILMLLDDKLLGLLLVIVMGIVISSLTSSISERKACQAILDNQDYLLCEVEAFDFDYRDPEKKCFVRDLSGNVLMSQTVGSDPAPLKVIYHAYLSEKDCKGRLLRVRNGNRGYLYVLFPDSYLSNKPVDIV